MVPAQAPIADGVLPRGRGGHQGYVGAVLGPSSVIGPLLRGLFTALESEAEQTASRTTGNTDIRGRTDD